jgi:uncharacterized protein YecE (DUF72 family)
MQFPYRFHYTPDNRRHLQHLGAVFPAFPLILEVRHRSWDQPEAHAWLRDLGIGFCNIDQPQISSNLGLTSLVTSDVGYLRLHGRNAAMWFQHEAGSAARYDYRYTPEEIEQLLDVLQVISRQARNTYLITNNHFRGQAVLNALELQYGLRRTPIPVPPPLLTAYPELEALARV